MRVWCEMMRDAPPGRKLAVVSSLTRTVSAHARRAPATAQPDWDRSRLDVDFVRIHHGKDLAQGVAHRLGVTI